MAGLRVGQFDFQAGTVWIRQTVVRGRRGKTEIGEPKSAAGRRTLGVPIALIEMVGKRMAARGLTADDGDALLFTAPDGGMLRYSNWLRRIWYPATVAAGLGEFVTDEATGRTRLRRPLAAEHREGSRVLALSISSCRAQLEPQVVETSAKVEITVTPTGGDSMADCADGFELQLDRPLDGRQVVDGASGQVVEVTLDE